MSESLHYHLLRTALKRYGEAPSALDQPRLNLVQQQARREYQIEQRVLASAEAASVHVPDAAVSAALAQLRARYEGAEQWQQALHSNGLDEAMLSAALARELLVEAVLEQVAARAIRASELDVQLFYQLHRERFLRPETRLARHILITINPAYAENTEQRGLERLHEIAARLRDKPQRFDEQAIKHSECPTALQGGMLGKVRPGQLYPALDQALFALGCGEVSDIVRSDIGWHLLLCESIEPQGYVSLPEATPRIRQHLEDRYRLQCQRSWLAEQGRKRQATAAG